MARLGRFLSFRWLARKAGAPTPGSAAPTAPLMDPAERRRRRRERIWVVALTILLGAFIATEVHLMRVSARLPFVNSIFFFGLMNLNIVLFMVLLFLVFRNAVKLVLDVRRGALGSRLKTRLVVCFTLFAIIPTVLLFTISALYIKSSFDKWFSYRIEGTLQKSIEVVKHYYENTEKQAARFARKMVFALEPLPDADDAVFRIVDKSRLDYGLDGLEYYRDPLAARLFSASADLRDAIPPVGLDTLKETFAGRQACKVLSIGTGELIRCGILLGPGKGVVFGRYFIPIALAAGLSEIALTYADYKSDNPLNYPIKSTYFAILSMVTLLILFAASWTGFYVARRLTKPIENLVEGTIAIAKGDLDYQIMVTGSDELYQLVQSFNKMTDDLRRNKAEIEASQSNLRKMNEELAHRRRSIEVLVENLQSGVLSLDTEQRVSMINPAARRLLPGGENAIGRFCWELFPRDFQIEIRELLAAVSVSSKPVRRELRFRTSGEEWITMLLTLGVLRGDQKQTMGAVVVLDDVTDIHKMERMSAWRGVAQRIAHEIKNPLTPIQLSVQRLRRRYLDKIADDGTFGEATQIILNEVDALKNLVSEFSSFARLPEVKTLPASLNDIVLDAVNLFRAAHEQVVFDLELGPLPPMNLDPAQLKRALINLFDNAVAAMDGRGKVSVTSAVDAERKSFVLTVDDEGCGIPEDAFSQLFEPNFSTKAGGTGLGLAIVQRIVADHGGFVRATRNVPRGTRFTIDFPESIKVDPRRLRLPGIDRLGESSEVRPWS